MIIEMILVTVMETNQVDEVESFMVFEVDWFKLVHQVMTFPLIPSFLCTD